MARKWMARAFVHAHGQFRSKARRAGTSTRAYARRVLRKGSRASTKTKRQANLARIGMRYGGRRRGR